jgi:hypothetical protein
MIGTQGDPYGSAYASVAIGSELKQVLTTTRERRSTMRKSEQLIVEVSLGNAKSLVRLPGKQVLEGAVGT